MSVHSSGSGVAPQLAPAKPRALGFLHIERYGGGPNSIYIVTYRRLENRAGSEAPRPRPVLVENSQALIELLERIGIDFHLHEVRGALEDILRLGSANIPDLWLSDEEMLEKGLVEG